MEEEIINPMKGGEMEVVTEGQDPVSVNVSNLNYMPSRKFLKKNLEWLRYELTLLNLAWLMPYYTGVHRKLLLMGAQVHNCTFKASSGELCALLGDEMERREVIELMTGRKKTGTFCGDISLSGGSLSAQSYYYDHVAFVQKKPLFIPGLTYMDMITYAAELRASSSTLSITARVDDIITIMNLHHCKHRRITEYPPTRGELGCDMRRLSIAIEIVHLPHVIVIDEPTLDFEPAISVKIVECLQALAKRGHIVLCSMAKPSSGEFKMMDKVVLLSEGHTVYCGPPGSVEAHFCSSEMGYERTKDVDIVDFIVDVITGIERPVTLRQAELPSIMQEKFEAGPLFEQPSHDEKNSHAFCADFFRCFGLSANTSSVSAHLYRAKIILQRAVVTKFKDLRSLQTFFGASFVVSSIVGYLQFGQGDYGAYCLSLFGLPYANTTNCGSTLFFVSLFSQAFFFNDSNAFCQKLQLFRYEQASGLTNAPIFFLTTAISEVPFGLMFGFTFSSIIWTMARLHQGRADYQFFESVALMAAMSGLSCAMMYCAIFKKELVVRDMFFFSLIVVVLLSGYPFSQNAMPSYMVHFSEIIPTRWIFEALYKWFFSSFDDGLLYLENYKYASFDEHSIFSILTNFLIGFNLITMFFLLPEPVRLKRAEDGKMRSESRDSMASADSIGGMEAPPAPKARASESVKPIMFMRESTVTGRTSKLSINMSQLGEENTSRGPTVMLKDVTYRVRDPKSPVGYKTVLNRVSGQFDWGKLNMIMGAPQCGKSSLINIIAGNTGPGTEVGGVITFNGHVPTNALWERCGFVPMHNDHIRDLTVREVITFAMKLRCYNSFGFAVLEENVKTTIENLHLGDVARKKVKYLNPGEYKRLSIAEEMVHGPKLLLMDEPTTGISLYETSVLLMTFREMVNADRTVVATMHQPSAEAFRLFDSLLLLSKGRVIYAGRLSNASDFFVTSPYGYYNGNYNNPAEFLADISGGQISDNKGEFIDCSLLENHYMQSENYRTLRSRLKAVQKDVEGAPLRNPLLRNANAQRNDISMSENAENLSFEVEVEADHKANLELASRPLPRLILAAVEAARMLCKKPRWADFTDSLFKRRILLHRAFRALGQRYELILGSVVLHVLLALLFAWINETITPPTVIAYFGIAAMFLIMANVQFIFFVYTSHMVLLKEYSRGLYSPYTNYTVSSIPMYCLKTVNAVLFATISWSIMDVDLRAQTFGFVILCFTALVLSGTMLAEVVIYTSPDLRSSYVSIPAAAFLQFVTSGLFLKAQSFPSWMGPWVPSLSMIRWIMQATFIAIYEGDRENFPLIGGTDYSQYTGFLNLFGWGGKSKWYCLSMICIYMAVLRFFTLLTSAFSAFNAKGTHKALDKELSG